MNNVERVSYALLFTFLFLLVTGIAAMYIGLGIVLYCDIPPIHSNPVRSFALCLMLGMRYAVPIAVAIVVVYALAYYADTRSEQQKPKYMHDEDFR